MMFAVPRVHQQSHVKALDSVFGVGEGPRPLVGGKRSKEGYPSLVECIEQIQRQVHRSRFCVLKVSPGALVIWFDRRLPLRKRETISNVAVDMAIGDVMQQLPDGPAIRTIRRIELLIRPSGYCGPH